MKCLAKKLQFTWNSKKKKKEEVTGSQKAMPFTHCSSKLSNLVFVSQRTRISLEDSKEYVQFWLEIKFID